MKQNRASSFTNLNEGTYLRQEFSFFFGSPGVCSVPALAYHTPAVVSNHAVTPVQMIPLPSFWCPDGTVLLAPLSLHQYCQENNPHGYARSVLSHSYWTQVSEKLEAVCSPGLCNCQLWYCQENWSPPLQMHSMHSVLMIALYWWRLDHSTVVVSEVHRIHSSEFFLSDGGKFHTQVLETVSFLVQCLYKLLHQARFDVQWREKNCLWFHQWFILTNYKLSSFRPVLFHPMVLFCTAASQTKKAEILRVSSLLS